MDKNPLNPPLQVQFCFPVLEKYSEVCGSSPAASNTSTEQTNREGGNQFTEEDVPAVQQR